MKYKIFRFVCKVEKNVYTGAAVSQVARKLVLQRLKTLPLMDAISVLHVGKMENDLHL